MVDGQGVMIMRTKKAILDPNHKPYTRYPVKLRRIRGKYPEGYQTTAMMNRDGIWGVTLPGASFSGKPGQDFDFTENNNA